MGLVDTFLAILSLLRDTELRQARVLRIRYSIAPQFSPPSSEKRVWVRQVSGSSP